MDRRAYLRTLGGLSTVGLAGCASIIADQSAEATDYDVGMSTMDFRPEVVEVAVGETVVWKNTSSHAHTVTAYESRIPDDASYFASGGFEDEEAARNGWIGGTEGALYQDDVYEHAFEVPGEYPYFCVPHEPSNMVGTVRVTDERKSPQN